MPYIATICSINCILPITKQYTWRAKATIDLHGEQDKCVWYG
jgi:hypothetical protein